MAIKNRTDLKSYFVKNAIPTEGNFADLIDSQLNQAADGDGVFKAAGEPFSVVAAPGDQKRVLRLYGNFPAANADWTISLSPAQDPANPATVRAGFGIADGAGATRLFVDAATGRIGVGTNNPQVALDVIGPAQANGFRGRYDLVLNDYRTVNPASNVCLQSPGNDRDAWIYRDAADATRNWGIYHRQIDAAVAGLPGNSIGFVGGTASNLQAYINLGDGSGWFAGKLNASGYPGGAGSVSAPTMEIGGPNPVANGTGGAVMYLHHHNVIAHQLRYNAGTLYFEAAGNGYGTSARPTLALGGDVSIEGKHAFRGNDPWLRLNQEQQFSAGVHTPGNFAPGSLNVGGVNGWGNPGGGNAWIGGTLAVNGSVGIGTQSPSHVLHVRTADAVGLFESTGTQAYLRVSTAEGLGNRVEFCNRPGGRAAVWVAGFGDALNVVRTGRVGVGVADPAQALHVGGNILASNEIESQGAWLKVRGAGAENAYVGGDGAGADVQIGSTTAGFMTVAAWNWAAGWMDVAGRSWLGHSDARSKENIEPVTGALAKLRRLRGVSFEWKTDPKGARAKNFGFLAQEVQEVIPEAVAELRGGSLSVAYNALTALLVEAIKEQQQQIDELRAAIAPAAAR